MTLNRHKKKQAIKASFCSLHVIFLKRLTEKLNLTNVSGTSSFCFDAGGFILKLLGREQTKLR